MRRSGEGDEGERELALEGIRNSYDAGFSNQRVRSNGLLNAT